MAGLTKKFFFFLVGKSSLAWLALMLQLGISGLWEYFLENFAVCVFLPEHPKSAHDMPESGGL